MAHAEDCNCPPCRYRRGEDLGQAPRLSVRLRADVREFLLDHDEGARGLIERLVDQERAGRGKRPRESPQLEEARARIRELEKQLEVVQAQLAQKPDLVVPSQAKPQLSDNSSESRLDNYAARFREGFRKNYRAGIAARRLRVKSQQQMEALQLGYCGTRGVARDALEQKELKKLGLTELNGRERLVGCLTVPLFGPTGKLTGFWGVPLKTPDSPTAERFTEKGLLATGAIGDEMVLVESVVESLAAFGAGMTGVQAADLLSEAWLQTLVQRGVRKVWLALSRPELKKKFARELGRLGVECWVVDMPEDRESRIDLLDHAPSWTMAREQARRS